MASSSASSPVAMRTRRASVWGSRSRIVNTPVAFSLPSATMFNDGMARRDSCAADDGGDGFSADEGGGVVVGSYTANSGAVRESSNRLATLALSAPGTTPSPPSSPDSWAGQAEHEPDDQVTSPASFLNRTGSSTSSATQRPIIEDAASASGGGPSPSETMPLFHTTQRDYGARHPLPPSAAPTTSAAPRRSVSWQKVLSHKVIGTSQSLRRRAKSLKNNTNQIRNIAMSPIKAIPAVILGVLMNVLDGVSYGMIIFPSGIAAFSQGFGGVGVSMFFVTCIVAQLAYTLGGSAFKSGNGSMMVECVPFLHVIAQTVAYEIGDSTPDSSVRIVATTVVAYAIGSILTGIVFYVLGYLRLGGLMGFFPRHILVGAIGAVGVFLFLTGLEVTARLEGDFAFSLDLLKFIFSRHVVPLWTAPLALAFLLRITTARYSHPFIVPAYFIAVPILFYVIVFIARIPMDTLRSSGWIFKIEGVDSPPFEYLSLFKLSSVDWEALGETMPTQFALVAFGLIHVPINIPSLALSLGFDDLDIDRELIAHGYSNVLGGLFGTVPNYLCYVNSVLFVKVGGDDRVASFMLAAATFAVFLVGPWVIGYLPVLVVGALIFVLGMDLIKEALWDTWGRVNRLEYATIVAIIVASTWSDFVIGLLVGIVCACVSFVVTSSQRRAIRTIMSGSTARSTVRRHPKHNAFLKSVGSQTRILKLQGHLFFGTISACEQTIRNILDVAVWTLEPIRFLIFDFSNAVGMDFSAAEAFLRLQRLLEQKGVVFVISGADEKGIIARALKSVDLWCGQDDMRVEVFEHLNEALEHCENAYLRSLYSKDLQPVLKPTTGTMNVDVSHDPGVVINLDDRDSAIILGSSPRRIHLKHAAHATLGSSTTEVTTIGFNSNFKHQPNLNSNSIPSHGGGLLQQNMHQPLRLLIQSFKPFLPEKGIDFWYRISDYFEKVEVEAEVTLWQRGDEADCFYLIESGMLRATYIWPSSISTPNTNTKLDTKVLNTISHSVSESMVAGTCSGEQTFLASSFRNTQVCTETKCQLWKMNRHQWNQLGQELGEQVKNSVSVALLRMSGEEQEVLISHLWTTMG